jgi:hypothetical protein
MQHLSDCDVSAVFRICSKTLESGPILFKIHSTRFKSVQSCDLLGRGYSPQGPQKLHIGRPTKYE